MFLSLASLVVLAGCHHEKKATDVASSRTSIPVEADGGIGNGAIPLPDLLEDASGKIDLEQYRPYEAQVLAELKGEQKFVVFFHANWCPTCVKWEEKLKSNIGRLPGGALILKADYDKEGALASELGVTKQSTAVMFNENGEIEDKVSDPNIEMLIDFFSEEAVAVVEAQPETEEYQEDNNDESEARGAAETAVYKDYTAEDKAALHGNTAYAVYFKADWCPTCQKFDAKLKDAINSFPDGTMVLKADYDKESELKAAWGVTQQTTVVVLDEDGEVTYKKVNPSIEEFKDQF